MSCFHLPAQTATSHQVLPRMPLVQALSIAYSGDMHLPSAFTIIAAARKLGVC
jgi:hypothetical protein